jgi:mannose/fructose/N-acetylgalactosamine-specific phosphotransferase system component IIC
MTLAQETVGAAALAVLELDAVSVGPLLLSRPFVVGPLVGAFLGDPLLGAGLGAAIEAVTLEELPLGGCLEISAPVAAAVAVWLAAGPCALPAEASFPAGLAVGWVHARAEISLRTRRAVHVRSAQSSLAQGGPPRLGWELASALALQVFATFIVVVTALLAAGPVLKHLWPLLPETLRVGARCAVIAAPWLGAGGLAASLWRKS